MTSNDEEIIARARIEIPEEKREERYGERPAEKLRDDLNENWDLTRALLRQIDDLQAQLLDSNKKLKWANRVKLALAGILGGAASKGIEVGVLALIHAFSR
jgi:hypothetical protein